MTESIENRPESAAGRPLLRVLGLLILACGCAAGYFIYQSLRSDAARQPEESFQAIVRGGWFLLGAVFLGVLYFSTRRRTASRLAQPSENAIQQGVAAARTMASISALAGVLCWLPLMPLLGPLGYAAAAVIAGLWAIRDMSRAPNLRLERGLAIAGSASGAIYFVVYTIFQ